MGLAPRREHIMCQMIFIVFSPVILAEEDLDGAPRGFSGVLVGLRDGIDELEGVVDGAVRVTV